MGTEIVITRVGNGWLIRPQSGERGLYPDFSFMQVASTLDELIGIVLRWGENTVPKDISEV